MLSGCASSTAKLRTPEVCTPRLSLHLLYEAPNPEAIEYQNSEDEHLYLSAPLLQCQHIDDVFYLYSMDGSGPTIRLDLSAQGQVILSTQTREHVQGNLAVLVDGQLLSMPIIQMPIDGRSLLVDGIADEVVAKSLVYSMRVQSNIGRYQQAISTVSPVIFQAGMPLFLVDKNVLEQKKEQEPPSSDHTQMLVSHTTETQAIKASVTQPFVATKVIRPRDNNVRSTPEQGSSSSTLVATEMSAVVQKLRSLPASTYTIQLIATPNYPLAKAVEQEGNIPSTSPTAPRYLYKTQRNKQVWYLVVQGEYASLQEARQAAQQHVRPYYQDAWIKRLHKVHQELDELSPAI
ncbi:MAG: SPOR domain-containing protein [Plesiomonas sp.]|uniref:SPOR domain-containing protein n=1 Tax=Plesiomonas sp. TaxID=2486279 RepID=UPI003F3EA459